MTTRRWALPLVPLYGAALAVENALRTTRLAAMLQPSERLRSPVISVGSLSAGGAGKTPLVIALAKLLDDRGWSVDVLSRGYGREGRGVAKVDLLAVDAARRFGDEPVLIADRTGVPVWVGASRFRAGLAAERSLPPTPVPENLPQAAPVIEGEPLWADPSDAPPHTAPPHVHLLDDGFQHRALPRQFDLVLATAEDLVDTLLPAGNLREPFHALKRANALAVREDELKVLEKPLRALVGSDVPLWTVRRTLRFPAPLGIFGAGLRPLAFCALARPENFAAMLAEAGCGVVDTVIFRDHHRYDGGDVTELIVISKRLNATGLLTTEKDAVKLDDAMRARLEAEVGPLVVVALDASFVYESPVVRLLESRLRAGAAHSAIADPVRSR